MHTIHLTRNLPFSKDQLMEVALDVEEYHEFVPYCERCVIREQSERAGREIMVAAMTVGVAIFRETFVSRVIADREAGTIQATGLEGPLKKLDNSWVVTELDEGTKVDFKVSFEFRSRLLAALASNRVEGICTRILNAFIARAEQKYGYAT